MKLFRIRWTVPAALVGLGLAWFMADHRSSEIPPVKIGIFMPFHDELGSVGAKIKNGVEMARKDLLAKHKGLDILIDYQPGCYESETASAVQRFVHTQVSIIGASFCVFGHIPVLPITEANKIITFNTAANPDVVLFQDFAFSTNVAIQIEAERMAEFAFKQLGARRSIMMHLDTPFGYDYNKYFKREFERLGGEHLLNVPNAPDNKNFTAAIKELRAAKPDIIVTAHFGVPLGTFYREVRATGITAPFLGNYETEDRDVLDSAGAAADGVMLSSSEPAKNTKAAGRFEEEYIRQFGMAPDVVSTNTYDDIVLGVEAHIKCRGDRDCMAEELHQTTAYHGVSGIITIGKSGAAEKPILFKVIKDRTFLRYDR